MNLRLFFAVAISALLLLSCSKSDKDEDAKPRLDGSLLSIESIQQKDLNEFNFNFKIQSHPGLTWDELGLAYKQNGSTESRKHIKLVGAFSGTLTSYHVLGQLQGEVNYQAWIYGIYKKDTVYSAPVLFKPTALQILTDISEYKFTKGNVEVLPTNIPQSSTTTGIRITLNDINCEVFDIWDGYVSFYVPTTVPSGLVTLKLQRKSQEAVLEVRVQ